MHRQIWGHLRKPLQLSIHRIFTGEWMANGYIDFRARQVSKGAGEPYLLCCRVKWGSVGSVLVSDFHSRSANSRERQFYLAADAFVFVRKPWNSQKLALNY